MEKYEITMFIDYSIKMHNQQKILLWAIIMVFSTSVYQGSSLSIAVTRLLRKTPQMVIYSVEDDI